MSDRTKRLSAFTGPELSGIRRGIEKESLRSRSAFSGRSPGRITRFGRMLP